MVIALLEGNDRLINKLKHYHTSDFALPAIVFHELAYGAFNSARVNANLQTIEALQFVVLEFSKGDAHAAGMVRAALKSSGTPIGPFDVLIAGQALSRKLTLLTNNIAEFNHVEGLIVENWLG